MGGIVYLISPNQVQGRAELRTCECDACAGLEIPALGVRPQRLRCAWCKTILREGVGPTSDGICASCAEEFFPGVLAKRGVQAPERPQVPRSPAVPSPRVEGNLVHDGARGALPEDAR